MRNVEGVVIDMEGVLIDGADILRDSYISCLSAFGVSYSEEDQKQYRGQSDRKIFTDLKRRYIHLITPLPMLVKTRNDHYSRLLETKAEPRAGVVAFLKYLLAHDVPLGLATYASEKQIAGLLEHLQMRNVFKVIVSNEMFSRRKPEPDIYKLAVHYLKIKADGCLVVESSQVGVESAAETGARVIAVPNNKTRNDDFSLSEYQIASLEGADIVDMLANVGFSIALPIGEES